ncbi:hypothetical protein BSD17_21115 [Salmonella enterica subsp. enterica serovar Java]|nr:hypothetical protein [Salmonella enterica]ECT8102121.1 hypothetical protein [Salmonella enterica subsp. enterica serovar Java]EGU5884611.1 hypothetical protein [Salmonella enterica]EKN5802835.1 dihydrodipicolinate synthase family protein [Salmonella enterica subsp. enterica]
MFKGAATPVMTPLNAQQEIDYNATEKVIEFLIGHKMDALLFLGSCGEFFAFSDKEKRDYIRFVCHRVRGRVPVLIGTGGTDIRQVTAAYSGEDERWFRRKVNALFPNAP